MFYISLLKFTKSYMMESVVEKKMLRMNAINIYIEISKIFKIINKWKLKDLMNNRNLKIIKNRLNLESIRK
jgi:hypothetical protein